VTAPAYDLSAAVLCRVQGHHAFEACVEQLATAIRLGVFAEGSMLPPERELAGRMAVSRATLREAIAALRQANLVSTQRGRGGGTVVQPAAAFREAGRTELADRADELADALTFRRIVEPGACHAAASRRLSSVHLDLVRATLDDVLGAQDEAAHRQADSRLHLAIATVTESPMTINAVTAVQGPLHDMLTAIPVLQTNIEHSNRQHRAVVRAIERGDAPAARREMERHCDDTAALLRGLLP